jgi:transposase
MGPTRNFGGARRRAIEQRVVLPQGVRLYVPGVAAQPRPRAVAGVRRGKIEHYVRVLGVAQVHPQVAGLGSPRARVEDRDRGVVRLDHPGPSDQLRHPIDQGLEQVGGGGDPAPEGGAGDADPVPGENPALAVEPQVVGELGHHDVGEQPGAGQPLVDRLGGEWGGGDRWNGVVGWVSVAAARGAGVGVPDPMVDPENWTTGEVAIRWSHSRVSTMGKTNRTHTPAFKAQVALAAIKGDRTISQVAAHYEIHVNLVAHWKKQLLEGAATVFDPQGKNTPPPDDPKLAELYEQIGRLQVELAFAKKISRSRLSGSASRSSRAIRS